MGALHPCIRIGYLVFILLVHLPIKNIPVIILTAHCDDKTGKMIKDLVPEGYFVKPSAPADILGTISLVLPYIQRRILQKS